LNGGEGRGGEERGGEERWEIAYYFEFNNYSSHI